MSKLPAANVFRGNAPDGRENRDMKLLVFFIYFLFFNFLFLLLVCQSFTLYMCVCMYVCIYIYTHTHTHTHTNKSYIFSTDCTKYITLTSVKCDRAPSYQT